MTKGHDSVGPLGTMTLVLSTVPPRKYYSAGMAGFSVPATEHSTMTTWGRGGEAEAVRHILDKVTVAVRETPSTSLLRWGRLPR